MIFGPVIEIRGLEAKHMLSFPGVCTWVYMHTYTYLTWFFFSLLFYFIILYSFYWKLSLLFYLFNQPYWRLTQWTLQITKYSDKIMTELAK